MDNNTSHIISIDISTSRDYSSISVVCRNCRTILHTAAYHPDEYCFNIPYYSRCPECCAKVNKHILKESI